MKNDTGKLGNDTYVSQGTESILSNSHIMLFKENCRVKTACEINKLPALSHNLK